MAVDAEAIRHQEGRGPIEVAGRAATQIGRSPDQVPRLVRTCHPLASLALQSHTLYLLLAGWICAVDLPEYTFRRMKCIE